MFKVDNKKIEDKIILSEEMYERIKEYVQKSIDDDLQNGYQYNFKAYGSQIDYNNIFIFDMEEVKLKKTDYISTVSSDEMSEVTSHINKDVTVVGNVIFHKITGNEDEKTKKKYKSPFNFYIRNVKIVPIIVFIDPRTKEFNMDIYVYSNFSGITSKKENIYIRTLDNREISINQYNDEKIAISNMNSAGVYGTKQ